MSEQIKTLGSAIVEKWPVLFRCWLYFSVTFLAAISDKIGPLLEKDQWPTPQRLTLAMVIGLTTGLISVRAFYDGSAQRHADAALTAPKQ